MTDYNEPSAPPAYQDAPKAGEARSHPDPGTDEQPSKSAKHSADSYPQKAQPENPYETIDFLGNVPGGPHAAAAEALATFSSSVGDASGNAAPFVHVPPQVQEPGMPQGPPFICPTCNTSYSRLEYLRRHERRHADIRPFTCPCGKSFSRSDVLARHKTKCRVVLSGEVEDTSTDSPRAKSGERSSRSGSSRSTRASRAASGEYAERSRVEHNEDLSETSVDPALGQMDPALQGPPPPAMLEQGEGADADADSYAHGAPTSYHGGSIADGDYNAAHKNAAAHYGATSGSARTHAHVPDSKLYSPSSKHGSAPGNLPRTSGASSSPYVSGAPAIHPELSSRYGGGSGNSTPNHSAYYGNGPSEPPQHTNGAYGAHYSGDSGAPPSGSGAGAQQGSGSYGLGKERYSVAGGALSPFANPALSSTVSPYSNTFSNARDTPHSSSPRPSAAAPSASGSGPRAPNSSGGSGAAGTDGAAAPSDYA